MTTIHEEGGEHARLAIKGKRTKRNRAASPPVAAAVAVATGELPEARGGGGGEGSDDVNEDEDMANCLMLLAQGRSGHQTRNSGFLSDKKTPPGPLGLGLDGVYQCKTCDKSFQSFQALGGHRASHKKPKNGSNIGGNLNSDEKKSASAVGENRDADESVLGSFLSLQVTSGRSKKPDKTHECSICKAEFASGQALGGHMRRHRNVVANANATISNNVGDSESTSSDRVSQEAKRPRNFLELDLNLPAPEDDHRSEKPRFLFASKDQILVFAASSNSLVDCHY